MSLDHKNNYLYNLHPTFNQKQKEVKIFLIIFNKLYLFKKYFSKIGPYILFFYTPLKTICDHRQSHYTSSIDKNILMYVFWVDQTFCTVVLMFFFVSRFISLSHWRVRKRRLYVCHHRVWKRWLHVCHCS